MRMNTAIANLITWSNHLPGWTEVPREATEPLVLMVSPMVLHLAEKLRQRLGHASSLALEPFPEVSNESLLVAGKVTCLVPVQGKVRASLKVEPNISNDELNALALAAPGTVDELNGSAVKKVMVRAPKLVSIVPE